MTDLIDFLRARLDEDATSARQGGQWDHGSHLEWRDVGGLSDSLIIGTDRVLAEVEAKRRIIDIADQGCEGDGYYWRCAHWPAEILLTLAQPYADHPDFDPRWRGE